MTASMFWIRPKSVSLKSYLAPFKPLTGCPARLPVGGKNRFQVVCRFYRQGADDSFDQFANSGKAQPTGQESIDSHLVGRIEQRRCCSPCLHRFTREPQTGK